MTVEEQEAFEKSIETLLRFYIIGREDLASCPPSRGGFVDRVLSQAPELYEGHEEFIWAIDKMIVLLYESGERNR